MEKKDNCTVLYKIFLVLLGAFLVITSKTTYKYLRIQS